MWEEFLRREGTCNLCKQFVGTEHVMAMDVGVARSSASASGGGGGGASGSTRGGTGGGGAGRGDTRTAPRSCAPAQSCDHRICKPCLRKFLLRVMVSKNFNANHLTCPADDKCLHRIPDWCAQRPPVLAGDQRARYLRMSKRALDAEEYDRLLSLSLKARAAAASSAMRGSHPEMRRAASRHRTTWSTQASASSSAPTPTATTSSSPSPATWWYGARHPCGGSGVTVCRDQDEKMEMAPDGKPLSVEAKLHKAKHRFRCQKCATVFCSKCNAVPYHLGFTCEAFKEYQVRVAALGVECHR